jgi:uncharacterized membrane protein
MITYILIGVVVMIAFELLCDYLQKAMNVRLTVDLGMAGRLLGIIFWPIYLIIFIVAFIKTYKNF